MPHVYLGIGSAGAQGGMWVLSRGLCDVISTQALEEEGRASYKMSDAAYESVLYLVWNVSGAILTVEYFKLCHILKCLWRITAVRVEGLEPITVHWPITYP